MNILIYFDALLMGDSMMFLPALRAVRQALPQDHITILCGRGKSYLAGAGHALGHMVADELLETTPTPTHPKPWRPESIAQLAGRHFDIIIDTQGRFSTTLTLKMLPHRRFVARSRGVILSKPFFLPSIGGGLHEHRGKRLLDLCSRALGQQLTPVLDWHLPAHYRLAATQILANHQNKPLLGIAPGSAIAYKCWPVEHYITLAQQQGQHRGTVILLGPAERELRALLVRALPEACIPEISNDPLLTIALAAHMSVTIANDSGGGHLLAAASPRHILLFYKNEKTAEWAPWARRSCVITPQMAGASSLAEIRTDFVAAQVERYFEEAAVAS